ncbi:MAG: hypothetical protein JJE36_03760 [Coriobacteriia bacterium]|nr:hypothetical protein [Coriobacteriia bacterium]
MQLYYYLRSYFGEDSGQGISEYLIILAVVVIAAIGLATKFNAALTGLWGSITSQISLIT